MGQNILWLIDSELLSYNAELGVLVCLLVSLLREKCGGKYCFFFWSRGKNCLEHMFWFCEFCLYYILYTILFKRNKEGASEGKYWLVILEGIGGGGWGWEESFFFLSLIFVYLQKLKDFFWLQKIEGFGGEEKLLNILNISCPSNFLTFMWANL